MQPKIDQSNNTISSRIDELMKERRTNQSLLAEEIGISQGTISRVKSGKFSKSKYLGDIAKILGTTVEYLLTGDLELKYNEKTSPSNLRIKEHDFMLISMYDTDAENSKQKEEVLMLHKSMLPVGSNEENLRFINQNDDAMSPKITKNSQVVFDLEYTAIVPGQAYVIKHGVLAEQARLLYPLPNGGVRVAGTPEQKEYFSDEVISKEDLEDGSFKVLGKVISVTTQWV